MTYREAILKFITELATLCLQKNALEQFICDCIIASM